MIVDHQFTPSEPDRLWGTAMTQYPKRETKLYSRVFPDALSRPPGNWSIDCIHDNAASDRSARRGLFPRLPSDDSVIYGDRGTFTQRDLEAKVLASMASNTWRLSVNRQLL